jgi:acyl-ACP thioesterase
VDVSQRFEVRYRVRFDEADASGRLRPSGFLRYAQDLAWQHSEAAGFDRGWYEERDTFWLVRNVALRVSGDVLYGGTTVGSTEITGWRRVWARRHTVFASEGARQVADVVTDWVLLTTEGRPTRIPEEISRYFAPATIYRPDKVALAATPPEAVTTEVAVRDADIDPLGHLNNAAYLDLVDESMAAGIGAPVRHDEYQAEYVRPALSGSIIRLSVWRTADGPYACRMTDIVGEELFRALVGA